MGASRLAAQISYPPLCYTTPHMTKFTRIPFTYWGDRIGLLVMLGGMGMLSLATFIFKRDELDTIAAALCGLLGAASIAVGLWAFFAWPWPKAISVDAKEVRVLLGAKETIVIPRKTIVRIASSSSQFGVSGNSIEYTVDGKKTFVRLYAHYRDEDGKIYKGWEIVDALNALLGK